MHHHRNKKKMEEWVWKKLATELDHDTFEKVRAIFNYCAIDSMLDNNVLNLILTRVPVRDYKHVSLVSKRWHGICQRPEYWLPHIHRVLTPLYPLPIVLKINPFLFKSLALEQKVGWLFSDSWREEAQKNWSDRNPQVSINYRDVRFLLMDIGKDADSGDDENFSVWYPSESGRRFHEIFLLRKAGLIESGKKSYKMVKKLTKFHSRTKRG
jgi:hypothetical protein